MSRASFADPAVMGELMARMLWEIEAVHFAPDDPYKLSSGLVSPFISTAASCSPIPASAPP